MIGIPFNDLRCLGAVTEQIATRLQQRDHELVTYAARFPTTQALAGYIRDLPQRDDLGLQSDVPKVRACNPAQRLRVPADDPNCVERAALYLAVAELIDPWPVRQLATLTLPFGRHTFPLESGAPVVLDPQTSADELALGLASYVPQEQAGQQPQDAPVETSISPRGPIAIDVNEAINYTIGLGQQAAGQVRNGASRAFLARNAIHDLVEHGRPPAEPRTVEAVAWLLELAKEVARQHGLRALTIVQTTALAIADLADDIAARQRQRNLSVTLNGHSVDLPSWVSGLGSIVGRTGIEAGTAAVAPGLAGRLAAMGITGKVFDLVQRDLAHDGYSLGSLEQPVQSFISALTSIDKKRVT